jgi:hypothetical protein
VKDGDISVSIAIRDCPRDRFRCYNVGARLWQPDLGAARTARFVGGLAGLIVSLMMGVVESTVTKQHEKAAELAKRKIESVFESQMKEISNADPLNIRDSLPDPLNVRGKLNRK